MFPDGATTTNPVTRQARMAASVPEHAARSGPRQEPKRQRVAPCGGSAATPVTVWNVKR
jgi:hypothetical protein